MKKVVIPFVLIIGFIFTNTAKANLILSLDTPTQNHTIGDIIAVTLKVDGLGNGVPLSLGAFDVNIAFDMSALSFAGYNLFDELGVASSDPLDLLADAYDSSFGDIGGGIVNIAEISFLSNFDLWDFQPGSFALAELFFKVDSAPSSSQISVDDAVFFDTNGDLISVTGVSSASVNTVPTPANSLLMGLGLFVLFVRQKFYSSEN